MPPSTDGETSSPITCWERNPKTAKEPGWPRESVDLKPRPRSPSPFVLASRLPGSGPGKRGGAFHPAHLPSPFSRDNLPLFSSPGVSGVGVQRGGCNQPGPTPNSAPTEQSSRPLWPEHPPTQHSCSKRKPRRARSEPASSQHGHCSTASLREGKALPAAMDLSRIPASAHAGG